MGWNVPHIVEVKSGDGTFLRLSPDVQKQKGTVCVCVCVYTFAQQSELSLNAATKLPNFFDESCKTLLVFVLGMHQCHF